MSLQLQENYQILQMERKLGVMNRSKMKIETDTQNETQNHLEFAVC